MSTGQLRVLIRAYNREKAWAPDYVANQHDQYQPGRDVVELERVALSGLMWPRWARR